MTDRIHIDLQHIDTPDIAARLREAGPIAPIRFDGVNLWIVTHHDALRRVLSAPDTFMRGAANWRALADGEVPTDKPLVQMSTVSSMFFSNGEDHRRARSILQGAFTHRRVRGLEPQVNTIVDELLDNMARAGGRCDLKAELSWPLSIRVLCELLGLTGEWAARLEDIPARIFSGTDTEVYTDIHNLATKVIKEKRDDPGDDLISALVQARDHEDRLTDVELASNVRLLVNAGFETTVGALTNAVRALLTHPDQYALLASDEVSWKESIDELLRYDTSVAMLPMVYTAHPVEIGGVNLPQGEPIMLAYWAANRDPQAYGDTVHTLDLRRPQKPRHMAFGHGVHRCLGEPLARLELEVALPRLFARFPDLALDTTDGDPPPTPSPFMHHPLRLPVLTGTG
ncbi:cytochrome P450 family protein [Allosalinactinospora lopnorensis]|uniref:cytochrome P450 family protein n=1 Tax=Allosalinactinospora lopnorensis TaxID=1352348 RepID=UPI0006983754|nr:cytochrome P450 [Allosalinactinospora lopnorensis]